MNNIMTRRGIAGIEEVLGATLWVAGNGDVSVTSTNCVLTSYGAGVVTDRDLDASDD